MGRHSQETRDSNLFHYHSPQAASPVPEYEREAHCFSRDLPQKFYSGRVADQTDICPPSLLIRETTVVIHFQGGEGLSGKLEVPEKPW